MNMLSTAYKRERAKLLPSNGHNWQIAGQIRMQNHLLGTEVSYAPNPQLKLQAVFDCAFGACQNANARQQPYAKIPGQRG
jgi:hypothetical protein